MTEQIYHKAEEIQGDRGTGREKVKIIDYKEKGVKANDSEKKTYKMIFLFKSCYLSEEKKKHQSLSIKIIPFTSQAVSDFTATEQDDIQKCH